jgi:hypothetical protein
LKPSGQTGTMVADGVALIAKRRGAGTGDRS